MDRDPPPDPSVNGARDPNTLSRAVSVPRAHPDPDVLRFGPQANAAVVTSIAESTASSNRRQTTLR